MSVYLYISNPDRFTNMLASSSHSFGLLASSMDSSNLLGYFSSKKVSENDKVVLKILLLNKFSLIQHLHLSFCNDGQKKSGKNWARKATSLPSEHLSTVKSRASGLL